MWLEFVRGGKMKPVLNTSLQITMGLASVVVINQQTRGCTHKFSKEKYPGTGCMFGV